jgi:UDP-glucose 4-epimerase
MTAADTSAYDGADVLVTGGAGFIGSHLVESLVSAGARVTVLDDLSAGRMENLAAVTDSITFHEGSITEPETVEAAIDGCTYVFHLAANASVPRSVEAPTMDFETNARGTQMLLNVAREQRINRIVIASSAAVYGEPVQTPIDESHPLSPVSPYGASKLAAEQLGLAYNETYDLPVTVARIFNSYGPRQSRYVMYDFLEKLRENPAKLEVLGTGEQTRQYCYVDDTVRALLLLGTAGADEAYNLAGDSRITIRELAETMVDLVAPGAEIEYGYETWDGDITTLAADTTKLSELGFEPTVSLEEGLERLIEWYG